MLYNSIKILHILSATLLLTAVSYSYLLWKNKSNKTIATLQIQPWIWVLPFALLQLISGFTMISLRHYDINQFWIKGCVIGFIIFLLAWFGFIFFMRKLSSVFFYISSLTLLCMIFFMTSKI